jgi:hypothetical protein
MTDAKRYSLKDVICAFLRKSAATGFGLPKGWESKANCEEPRSAKDFPRAKGQRLIAAGLYPCYLSPVTCFTASALR